VLDMHELEKSVNNNNKGLYFENIKKYQKYHDTIMIYIVDIDIFVPTLIPIYSKTRSSAVAVEAVCLSFYLSFLISVALVV